MLLLFTTCHPVENSSVCRWPPHFGTRGADEHFYVWKQRFFIFIIIVV